MNRNDLTTLLREQAATVIDDAGASRADAVRRRGRRTQQRRTTGLVVATVVAVAGTIGIVNLPRGREVPPAAVATRVVGREVPKTVTTLGGTYRYVKAFEGKGSVTFTLPEADREYVLRAATKGDAGSILLHATNDGDTALHLPAGGFGYATTARASDESMRQWSAVSSADVPVAVAVYEFSKPPPGYTQDGITFPEKLAGSGLINAVVGERGQGEVNLSVPGKSRELQIVPYCSGVEDPEAYGVSVSFDGKDDLIVGSCGDEEGPTVVRSGAGSGMADTTRHEAWARLVDAKGRDVATPPAGVRIGFAVYEVGPERPGGLAESIEFDGHLWRLSESTNQVLGPASATYGDVVRIAVDSTDGPAVVAWSTSTPGRVGPDDTMRLLVDSQGIEQVTSGGTAFSIVSNGQQSTAAIALSKGNPATHAAMGVYQLAN